MVGPQVLRTRGDRQRADTYEPAAGVQSLNFKTVFQGLFIVSCGMLAQVTVTVCSLGSGFVTYQQSPKY